MWVKVGYMNRCVDRDLKCVWTLVTWNCVCRESLELWLKVGSFIVTELKSHSALCQAVYLRKVEQQSVAVLHTALFSRWWHCNTISVQIVYLQSLLLCTSPNRHCSTIYTINTTTHSCWTCHYAVTVLQYVQCLYLPNCTATLVGFFQHFITPRPKERRCWHVLDIRKSYNLCYHFILACLQLDCVAGLTCLLRWCA
jgi:hypothetical protein